MNSTPVTPLIWWTGRRAGEPPVAPAAAGRSRPVVGSAQPAIWWVQQRGASPGPPAASMGFPRPWIGVSWPCVVWNNFLPRVGGGGGGDPTYVVGAVYPSALAASSRFAGDGADPWAGTTSTAAAIADPSAASTRRLGNRP